MKPIESVTIHFRGDRSVGINSATFEMGLYIDRNDVDIEFVRKKITELYEHTEGETPSSVMFDFEIEAMNAADDRA
jgi:hypothetical protein